MFIRKVDIFKPIKGKLEDKYKLCKNHMDAYKISDLVNSPRSQQREIINPVK